MVHGPGARHSFFDLQALSRFHFPLEILACHNTTVTCSGCARSARMGIMTKAQGNDRKAMAARQFEESMGKLDNMNEVNPGRGAV